MLIAGVGLTVGASVAVAGIIGFVGLIVPHLVRPLTDRRPSQVIVPSALAGALLVLVAALMARQPGLIATVPTQIARLHRDDKELAVRKAPFMIIPIELQLAWSPLLQHDPGHIWLRRLIVELGHEIIDEKNLSLSDLMQQFLNTQFNQVEA